MSSYGFYARFEACTVAASQKVEPLWENERFDPLGPCGSYRLQVCWVTGHGETFFVTEGPMLARKWRLKEFCDEGMILEHVSGNDLMLARPMASFGHQVLQVDVFSAGTARESEVKVRAYRLSGKEVYQCVHDGNSFTYFDLYKTLFLQNKEEFFLVKFISNDGTMVGRASYHLSVTSEVPKLRIPAGQEPELKRQRIM